MVIPLPPPALARDLRHGTRLVAGLGHSTVLPSFDFEVYSEAGFEWDETRQRWVQPAGASGTAKGLPLVGAAVYAQHPSTEVLCMAYNLKDGRGRRLWTPYASLVPGFIEYMRNRGDPLAEGAITAGLALANSVKVSRDWHVQKVVRPKAGRR